MSESPLRGDAEAKRMNNREISFRFLGLRLSQRRAIAQKLGIDIEQDINQRDVDWAISVVVAVRERGLMAELADQIVLAEKHQ